MTATALAAGDTTVSTVSTFDELQKAVNTAEGTESEPTVITIDGAIEVTSEIELSRNSNKHIKLTGGTLTCSGLNDNMFGVNSGCSLTLENITLDGTNHPQNYYLVDISAGALILNDGAVLQNNNDTAIYIHGQNAALTMNGGKITGNHDTRSNGNGAAVFVPDNTSGYVPKITIRGGEITGNSVGGNGGAISITNYCDLTITGGKISGNSASKNGGGIYIGTTSTQNRDPVQITGGEISDNTASGQGANIYSRRDITLGT